MISSAEDKTGHLFVPSEGRNEGGISIILTLDGHNLSRGRPAFIKN
jgi:hypothetical protein